MNKPKLEPTDALLLITPQCPHCPAMMAHLTSLVKSGEIGRLEIINIANHPELAEDLGVKTVPWMRLGPYDLEGSKTLEELRQWAQRARDSLGMADYFAELLIGGKLAVVEKMVRKQPHFLEDVVQLVSRPDTNVHVRVGIGALLEQLQDTKLAHNVVHDLAALLAHRDPRLRADAVHYLILSQSVEAIPYLEQCLEDSDEQVQEFAAEGLEELQEKLLIHK